MQADANAQWVPAAVAQDVKDGTVVPASLPTGAIAVWRSASGKVYANGDRCPHRGMRLSHGFVRGETLACIYHGWRYGTDGACTHIPAHPSVVPPKTINCGPLPVTEQDGVVWVASSAPGDGPTSFPGYSALRSIVIAASSQDITSAAQGEAVPGGIATSLADHSVVLLMNARGPSEVFVIALVPSNLETEQKRAASSAFEALRRSAEAKAGAAE